MSTIGRLGMPSIVACFIPALTNPDVQIVAVAMPCRSSCAMSCTLHDTHDPQSPTAVTTPSYFFSDSMMCGSANRV